MIFGESGESRSLPSGEVLGLPPALAAIYDLLKPEPTDIPTPPGLGSLVQLPLRANARTGMRWLIQQEAGRGDKGPISVAKDLLTRSAREGAKAGGSETYHAFEHGPISQSTIAEASTSQGILRYPVQVLTELRRLFGQASEPFVGSVNRFRGLAPQVTELVEPMEQELARTSQKLRMSGEPREEVERRIQMLTEKLRAQPVPKPSSPPPISDEALAEILMPPRGREQFLGPIEKITLGGGAYPR